MNNIYRFENDTGTFFCFNEFQSEDKFEEFVGYIRKKLSIFEIEIQHGPYSIFVATEYKDRPIYLIYDEYSGCCIRTDKENSSIGEEIIGICYPVEPMGSN